MPSRSRETSKRKDEMSASTLQDMVTGALLGEGYEEQAGEQSLVEIATGHSTGPALLLSEGRSLEEFLASEEAASDPDLVRQKVAELGAMYVSAENSCSTHMTRGFVSGPVLLLHALDFAAAPSAEKIAEIQEVVFRNNNYIESEQITGNFDSALQYVAEFWPDDHVDRLAGYTGSTPQTVRRWLAGNTPGSAGAVWVNATVRCLFELQVGCRMSPEEARQWWDTPLASLGGKTPDEELRTRAGWNVSPDLRKAIAKVGGGIGFREY